QKHNLSRTLPNHGGMILLRSVSLVEKYSHASQKNHPSVIRQSSRKVVLLLLSAGPAKRGLQVASQHLAKPLAPASISHSPKPQPYLKPLSPSVALFASRISV